MAKTYEGDKYIKCSKCKSKYEKDQFGLNRFSNMYKTCISCRNKNKKKVSTKKDNNEISLTDYIDVDNELRAKYEKEFMMDSRDTKYSYFTEEEQVERYAKMLLFWDTNKPEITSMEDMMNNPRNNTKLFYIGEMRSKTYKQILEKLMNEYRN